MCLFACVLVDPGEVKIILFLSALLFPFFFGVGDIFGAICFFSLSLSVIIIAFRAVLSGWMVNCLNYSGFNIYLLVCVCMFEYLS